MLFYFALFLVVLLAWLAFSPDWTIESTEKQLAGKWGSLKENSNGWMQKVRTKFQQRSGLGISLKAWAFNQDLDVVGGLSVTQREELSAFRSWLQGLTEAEADAVARELAEFCQRRQVDIRWLLADNGTGDMQAVLSILVLYYGLAVRERAHAQPASALRAWQEAPGARKNRQFGELLYVQLVNAGKISIPPGLLFASEAQRRMHMVDELQALIAKDRDSLLEYAARALETAPQKEQPWNFVRKGRKAAGAGQSAA